MKKISYISFSSLFLGPLIFLLFPIYVNGQNAYSSEAQKLLDQAFYYADEIKDYERSIPLFLEAIEIEKKRNASDSLITGIYYSLYHAYGYNRNYPEAIKINREVLTYNEVAYGYSDKRTIDAFYDIGYLYDQIEFYDSALFHYEKSVEYYKAHSGEYTHDVALTYHNMGAVLGGLRRVSDQIEVLHKALNIWQEIYGEAHHYTITTYTALGTAYRSIGDLKRAFHYLEKALILSEKTGEITFNKYAEIGTSYSSTEYGEEKSILYLKKALELVQKEKGGDPYSKSTILSLLAERYRNKKDYDLALTSYEQSIKLIQNQAIPPQSLLSHRYICIGRILREKEEHLAARKKIRMGLRIAQQLQSPLYFAFAADQISLSFQETKDFDSALLYRNYGLSALIKGDYSMNDRDYLVEIDPKQILPIANYYIYLVNRSSLFLESFEAGFGDESFLDLAEQGLETASILSKSIDARGAEDIAFRRYLEDYTEVYINLMLARQKGTSDQNLMAKAFSALEEHKARILLANIMENQARKFSGIPDSVQKREQGLKENITVLNQQIYLERRKGSQTDTSVIREIQSKLFKLNQKLDEYIASLEEKYPDYHELKYQKDVSNAFDIQHHLLDSETALIEYFWGKEHLFLFTIQKNDISLKKLLIPDKLEENILAFRGNLETANTYRNTSQNIQNYQILGYEIYHDLLEPAISELHSKVGRLIIIPDKQISYIPFEVLIYKNNNKKDFRELNYLIKQYDFDYAYSATVLSLQMREISHHAPNLLAVFAPDYTNYTINQEDTLIDQSLALLVRNNHLPLPGAKAEAEKISKLLNGEIFLENRATEGEFKRKAANYQILHLAMHTLMEEENPLYSRLLFSQPEEETNDKEDNNLYAAELYNLRLQSDLVVLSACNTGYGRFSQNEGLMSISRAFTYAGCPSVIMSLWKVPDKETSRIMVDFYENLKEGESKDRSLRQAKLTYLNQAKAGEMGHPFYWAGFIAMGNHEPIELNNQGWLEWMIAGILLTLILRLGWLSYKNQQKP